MDIVTSVLAGLGLVTLMCGVIAALIGAVALFSPVL